MKHGDIFSGIGGWSLAARWMGWETVFHCEIDKFCQKVLTKHFPNSEKYHDIKETDFTKWRGLIDILTLSTPCQPFSIAGKQKGSKDERHLWGEGLRAISEIQPQWLVVENVPGLITVEGGLVFEQMLTDLENAGYEVQPFVIPAASKNAPHKRDRVWIVAYSESQRIIREHREHREQEGKDRQRTNELNGSNNHAPHPHGNLKPVQPLNGGEVIADPESAKCEPSGGTRTRRQGFTNDSGDASNTSSQRPSGPGKHRGQLHTEPNQEGEINRVDHASQFQENWYEVATRFCSLDAGVSGGLVRNRVNQLKAYGNSIVPQVAYELFKAINKFHNQTT